MSMMYPSGLAELFDGGPWTLSGVPFPLPAVNGYSLILSTDHPVVARYRDGGAIEAVFLPFGIPPGVINEPIAVKAQVCWDLLGAAEKDGTLERFSSAKDFMLRLKAIENQWRAEGWMKA